MLNKVDDNNAIALNPIISQSIILLHSDVLCVLAIPIVVALAIHDRMIQPTEVTSSDVMKFRISFYFTFPKR